MIQAPRTADEKIQPRQLTSGRFDEGNLLWAKDGTQLYFASLHIDEPYYERPKSDLYSVAVKGGAPVKINSFDMDTGGFSLSPDGKQLAFIASTSEPINSYTQPDLWVVDLAPNAKPRNLTANFDWDIANGVFGDNAAPRGFGGNVPIWTADGSKLIELFGREGKSNLGFFDVATGAETDITKGNQAVMRFRATPDGAKLVYLLSTPTRINDLFALDQPGAEPRQLTHSNDELFGQLNLTEPEEIRYQSFDGKRIQAWLQKPPGFDAAKNIRSS